MLFNLLFRKEITDERDYLSHCVTKLNAEVGRLERANRILASEGDQLRRDLDKERPRCCECIDALTRISEENTLLKSKIAEAQKWFAKYADRKNQVTLTCAYCGEEYPPDTPASQGTALYQHIKQCEKHPMKKLLDFVRLIDSHIIATCNEGYIWINITPEMIKELCGELLK